MTALAQNKYRPTPVAWRNTLGYYLLFVSLGMGLAVTGPTLPSLASQTGSTVGQMGFLFFVGPIGYMLGTLAGGHLFDRLRGHPIIGFSQMVDAALMALIPFMPSLWSLVLLIAVKAFADGIINTGSNTLLVWTHGKSVAPFMNGLHFCFGLGAFVSPLIVAQLFQHGISYQLVYWILAAFSFVASLVMLSMPKSPKQAQSEEEKQAGPVRVNYILVAIAALFLFFYVGAEVTYGNWIFSYASILGLSNEAMAAYMNSAFWLSFTIGRLISIFVATQFKPQQVIPVALFGCLGFAALVILVPSSSAMLWIVTIGLGFCMAPVWPTGFTLAGQIINMNARISSLVLLGDGFGGMILPWLVGQILDLSGPRAMVYLVFSSLVLNLLAFVFLSRGRRQKQVAQPAV
jgi:FHS family Na+ dependent glucose MFS transporter 1